jgi:hypothetical protein
VDSPPKRKKAQSHKKVQKTRRLPTVSCTHCWAALVDTHLPKSKLIPMVKIINISDIFKDLSYPDFV